MDLEIKLPPELYIHLIFSLADDFHVRRGDKVCRPIASNRIRLFMRSLPPIRRLGMRDIFRNRFRDLRSKAIF